MRRTGRDHARREAVATRERVLPAPRPPRGPRIAAAAGERSRTTGRRRRPRGLRMPRGLRAAPPRRDPASSELHQLRTCPVCPVLTPMTECGTSDTQRTQLRAPAKRLAARRRVAFPRALLDPEVEDPAGDH